MEAFSELKTSSYSLDPLLIRENIWHICRQDKDSTLADYRTRSYYLNHGTFLWIDRIGIDSRADSLLSVLGAVDEMGFTQRSFDVPLIKADLQRIRQLEFNDSANTINDVMARLEYRLTKAFLRYTTGQRFGFVNPYRVFNRMDPIDTDSTGKPYGYRKLFDLDVQRPGKSYFAAALRKIYNDSVSEYLKEVQPRDPLYHRLQRELQHTRSQPSRMRILCNMERRRWREPVPEGGGQKHVVVNIPAFHLYAYAADTVVDMRVGCGTLKTKTPMLASVIERMDVNPQWNIPMSIITKEIVNHAGDISYFERNRYYIAERKTGHRLDLSAVTADMLRSGAYRVTQEGGAGNALGRIVFRFKNNFSVFLHDTSSKDFFERGNRGVSHGCVRVERPFDLARFLLDSPDDWMLDKLRISMDIPPETSRGIRYVSAEEANRHLVSSLNVSPRVPLYIVYYTLYPEPGGSLKSYPDVYGYDKAIGQNIKPFMQ